MAVQEATPNDFRLVQNGGHNVMTINRRGYTLVFFKMTNCAGCDAFAPVFSELSVTAPGIDHFVSANVSAYRNIVSMSRNTKTPIQTVPLIILYIDGEPYAKYTGKRTLPDVLSFITKNVKAKSHGFMQNPAHLAQAPPQPQQRGMYGQSQYNHPVMHPDMQGVRQPSRPQQQYAHMGEPEDEDEEKLLVPNQVTPHNVPWEGNYRRMGGTID